MSSSPANSPTTTTTTFTDDEQSRTKWHRPEEDTPSPASPPPPSALHAAPGRGPVSGKGPSAFLPYRPPATVLTNLQRGNTEATFCPTEVSLSFHERAGQGEITAEQVRLEVQRQSDSGANIDFQDAHGFTSLHWAAYYGQLVSAQLLLGVGANANAEAPEFVTPLQLAACGGHHELVRLLLEFGACASHMDIVGNTALMYAAAGNHPQTCNELLARDPDVTSTNENGDSAYSLAVESGSLLAQAVLEQYLGALLSGRTSAVRLHVLDAIESQAQK